MFSILNYIFKNYIVCVLCVTIYERDCFCFECVFLGVWLVLRFCIIQLSDMILQKSHRHPPWSPARPCADPDTFNWRLSCRRSNWETRTCPCTDSARCPGAQLSVFAQTSARISSCSRWAVRTGWSRCSS